MDCLEFYNTLAYKKNHAVASVNETLRNAFLLSKKKILSIETGGSVHNLEDIMAFIRMCGLHLEITIVYEYHVDTVNDLRSMIKTERENARWSIETLSSRSGVHQNIVYAFEQGYGKMRLDSFLRIIDAFGAILKIE